MNFTYLKKKKIQPNKHVDVNVRSSFLRKRLRQMGPKPWCFHFTIQTLLLKCFLGIIAHMVEYHCLFWTPLYVSLSVFSETDIRSTPKKGERSSRCWCSPAHDWQVGFFLLFLKNKFICSFVWWKSGWVNFAVLIEFCKCVFFWAALLKFRSSCCYKLKFSGK